MDWRTLVGWLSVGLVAVAVLGVAVTLTALNPLFSGSDWQTKALASLGVVALSLLAFVLLGSPSRRWRSTPYW